MSRDLKQELLELKAKGEAADWLSEEGYIILAGGYLLQNETPKTMYKRVARSAAEHLGKPELEDKFFDYMWKGWLCPATPVLTNSGTSRALPISCFTISISDTLQSITEGLGELSALTKAGGGVGIVMDSIRSRGSLIQNGVNGHSSGVVPFIKMYDSTVLGVSQGAHRRGAASVNLNIEHGDWEEFIRIRRPEGDVNRQCHNIHQCTIINNDFMERVKSGDHEARRKWAELMRARLETGESYIFFKDKVNEANPEGYKALGLNVEGTNICCLAGDTKVLTSEGNKRIKDLVGKQVKIYDGNDWVDNDSFELKGKAKLIRITLSNGSHIDCTANHRWFLKDSPDVEVLADKLFIGAVLEATDVDKDFVVSKLEELPGVHDVYCPKVESTGKFALTIGVMTGNSEITLHTDDDHSFICCLSSLNLTKWDEWKDTDLPEVGVHFLNGVLNEFIVKSEGMWGMEKARRSAIKGRAIGLGVLGWHTLLQSKMMPFESFASMQLNNEIFATIKEGAMKATKELAQIHGEPEWCKGTGMYNSHLTALAPTRSNSIISGDVSFGIEPIVANAYMDKTHKGKFSRKNKVLKQLLEERGEDTDKVWQSIHEAKGSVQHLDCLDTLEKQVFKTAYEIDQKVLVQQASQRGAYICQAQSLNLFFPHDADHKYLNAVHLLAYDLPHVKTLYYCRSTSGLKLAVKTETGECSSCEG